MKTDNLFKFASIRPPRHASSLGFAVISSDAESELVAEVHQRVENGETVEKARKEVAEDYMEGEHYYRNSEPWEPLLDTNMKIQDLLIKLESVEDAQNAKREIRAFFRGILDITVQEFIASQNFPLMKQQIWDSYYANVILPNKRPFEREELVAWLKVFHILSNWSNNNIIVETVMHLDKIKPVVPKELMTVPDAPQVKQPKPEDSVVDKRKKDFEKISRSIKELRRTKSIITNIFQAKVKAAEEASEEILRFLAISQGEQKQTAPDVRVDDPARLKPDDFTKHSDVLALLESNEIDPFEGTTFDVISKLDESIARQMMELGQLQIREHTVFINGLLVRIRKVGKI